MRITEGFRKLKLCLLTDFFFYPAAWQPTRLEAIWKKLQWLSEGTHLLMPVLRLEWHELKVRIEGNWCWVWAWFWFPDVGNSTFYCTLGAITFWWIEVDIILLDDVLSSFRGCLSWPRFEMESLTLKGFGFLCLKLLTIYSCCKYDFWLGSRK